MRNTTSMTETQRVATSTDGNAGPGLKSLKGGNSGDAANSRSNRLVEHSCAAVVVFLFLSSALCLHAQQFLGFPLYYIDQRLFDAWQAMVKESTALLLIGLNQWRAPTQVVVTGDSSVQGQIRVRCNGKMLFDFPGRIVVTANHQIYTDWIYLWWSAYTSRNHGRLIVVLKDTLRNIPILGLGMRFFSWIFLSRRWDADESRIRYRISQLSNDEHSTPMWLLIFPEGTNLSARSRKLSQKWASKTGISDFEYGLIPRSRGLQLCLQELNDSVQWMYDCTIAYDGIPKGQDAQDHHNLKSIYIKGKKPPVAHIHWRRFAVSDIPVRNSIAFDEWLYARWEEKDKLLKHHDQHGTFPSHQEQIRASVELENPFEGLQILGSLSAIFVLWKALLWAIDTSLALWEIV